jgi:hypothetical protein
MAPGSGVKQSVAGWDTMLQAGKVEGSSPDEVTGAFNWPNPSSPGVESASNRHEYQESCWGQKAGSA